MQCYVPLFSYTCLFCTEMKCWGEVLYPSVGGREHSACLISLASGSIGWRRDNVLAILPSQLEIDEDRGNSTIWVVLSEASLKVRI